MAYWSASLTLAEGERPVQLSPGSGLFPWVSRRQDSTWLFAEGRCWRHEGWGGSCQSWVPQIWDREEEKNVGKNSRRLSYQSRELGSSLASGIFQVRGAWS